MGKRNAAPVRHFLDLDRIERPALRRMLEVGTCFKQGKPPNGEAKPLAGKALAMIFEKPSTRTRVSFELGMRQLGGEVIMLDQQGSQLGRGETVADTARVLSRYVDIIMLRTTKEEKLLEMAEAATVPVINGLTNRTHPCQLMADVMTFEEHRGPIAGRTVAWCGDGNNMATSWIQAAVQFQFELRLACPEPLAPPPAVLAWAKSKGAKITVTVGCSGGRGQGRLRGDGRLGLHGRRARGQPPSQPAGQLPRRRARDGHGQARCHLHALPAGPSRRGGDGRRHRRSAVGGVGRGREPPARAEGHPRLVPGRHLR